MNIYGENGSSPIVHPTGSLACLLTFCRNTICIQCLEQFLFKCLTLKGVQEALFLKLTRGSFSDAEGPTKKTILLLEILSPSVSTLALLTPRPDDSLTWGCPTHVGSFFKFVLLLCSFNLKISYWEFPGGPVVRIHCCHWWGLGFSPWLGNKDPASLEAWPPTFQLLSEKQYMQNRSKINSLFLLFPRKCYNYQLLRSCREHFKRKILG